MTTSSIAAQQNASQTASAAAAQTAAIGTGAASTSGNALTTLSNNFQDFLSMLLTQLQNQDPTSPMDTNTFTQELVAFTGVEQQINTNGSLTQLIQLTQSGELLNSASMVGHQVDVTSGQLSLQNGVAGVKFTGTAGEAVNIQVSDASGNVIENANVTATAGSNNWSWNGQSSNGTQYPDGAYTVAVTTGAAGAATAVPFTVVGTATGVTTSGSSLQLNLGSLAVNFSAIQSLVN
jgi:flagellar basal-body rod modification protein FlgD